eukprot:2241155-Prymnesium_polylepis.1
MQGRGRACLQYAVLAGCARARVCVGGCVGGGGGSSGRGKGRRGGVREKGGRHQGEGGWYTPRHCYRVNGGGVSG